MCDVRIVDTGDTRKVTIEGTHHTFKGRSEYTEFETFYSAEFLRRLFEVKREWMKDEIDRLDNPQYVEAPLLRVISMFSVVLKNRLILDFGCGSGASSIILAKLGADHVIGVDVDESCLQVAHRRLKEHALGHTIWLCRVSPRAELPFRENSFDVVICNGVFEHVYPQLRRAIVRGLWRVVRNGGYLVVTETPNRLWPYDGHNTHLWFISYLPLRIARLYALLFNRIGRNESIDDLLSRGFRGVTYWEVVGAVANGCIECNRSVMYSPFSDLPEDARWHLLKIGLRFLFNMFDRTVVRALGLHPWMFVPYLSICMKKHDEVEVYEPDEARLKERACLSS